jgi:hypothetical protein
MDGLPPILGQAPGGGISTSVILPRGAADRKLDSSRFRRRLERKLAKAAANYDENPAGLGNMGFSRPNLWLSRTYNLL